MISIWVKLNFYKNVDGAKPRKDQLNSDILFSIVIVTHGVVYWEEISLPFQEQVSCNRSKTFITV